MVRTGRILRDLVTGPFYISEEKVDWKLAKEVKLLF